MAQYKVAVTDLRHKDYEPEAAVLKTIGAELSLKHCTTEDEVITHVKDADGILVNLAPMSAKVIRELKRCKVIARYGVGFDNVDVAAATEKKIWVTNVTDYCDEDVSDQAVTLLMSCVRKSVSRTIKIRAGEWNTSKNDQVFRIAGKTLGFVGFGRIARTMHRKMKGFNLGKFLAYDPFLPPNVAKEMGVEMVDLDTLISQSDYISVHAPLAPQTKGIIGEKQFSIMKPNAILVNTSRGPLIDEKAMYQALRDKKINSAGLDVFVNEPIEKDNPLLTLDNAVLSDHQGWYSEESMVELKTKAARNIKEVLEGRPPLYPVNKLG